MSQGVDKGDPVYLTTPLAMLPNDAIFFYMSLTEYANVYANNGTVRITRYHVSVVPQGLRTAFDTGTSLSGMATSEHCAICMKQQQTSL